MTEMLSNSIDSAVGNSIDNENQNPNLNNIHDTSIMVDPRKSIFFKPKPEEYEIDE